MMGILLCGGAGRRVAGADKPLLNWRGQPLFTQVLARLRPQVERLVISANRNHDLYARYAPVIADDWIEYQGPMAGIASVIKNLQSADKQSANDSVYLICPGDMPALPSNLGVRLCADRSRDQVCVAHDGERLQPLCMVCGDRHLPSMIEYLHSGHRSVQGWLQSVDVQTVSFNDPAAFRNINEPEDFAT